MFGFYKICEKCQMPYKKHLYSRNTLWNLCYECTHKEEEKILNNNVKKQAISKLQEKQDEYKSKYNEVLNECINLYELRKETSQLISMVQMYINLLANKPKGFNTTFESIDVNLKEFDYAAELEQDYDSFLKILGVSVSSRVASFLPTEAMAVATTFGIVSRSTTISSLTGKAATNTALAWIAGEAITARGVGIASENSILALVGPVGWAIGETSLLCGGVLLDEKNKKIIEEAAKSIKTIEEEIQKLDIISNKIKELNLTIKLSFDNIQETYFYVNQNISYDYLECSYNDKCILGELVNNCKELSALLNERIN